jgi:hypothetical protein
MVAHAGAMNANGRAHAGTMNTNGRAPRKNLGSWARHCCGRTRRTEPLTRILRVRSRRICQISPSGLGHDPESKGEVAERLQPRTVEAMCKANWPAQRRSTEAQQATLKSAATCGLEGMPPREENVASPRGSGPKSVGAGNVTVTAKTAYSNNSQFKSTKDMSARSPSHPRPHSSVANLQDFGLNGVENEGERPGVVVAESRSTRVQ